MKKRKKIGIVTITNDGYNFGNRLQNYALQTILEGMGFEVETLNRPIRGNQRNWWLNPKLVLHYILPYKRKIEHIKAKNFFFWNRRHIKWSNKVAIDETLPSLKNRYDYFVAGSDQIWNPKFTFGKDPFMYLQFARAEQRIAYSASIGVDNIETSDIPLYTEWCSNWKAISIREYKGTEIVSQLLNKEIPTLIDPTLLLAKEEWCKLTRRISTPKKYIVVYTLGTATDEYIKYINQLAEKNNCDIVDVMNDYRYAGGSPSKFVALIQNSERVVSDSFHAMVFSLVFHKKFTFLQRAGCGINMNSRIQTLINKFQIPINELSNITEINVDWDSFDLLLKEEQNKSMLFLENALQ